MKKLEFTESGILSPSVQETRADWWQEMISAFGPDINQSDATPQGQLVTSNTAITQDAFNQFIELSNMFDPRYATGIWQDALGAIYFLERKRATRSVVALEFTGLVGATIPTGFQVSDENGNIWQTTGTFTIASNGKALATAQCSVFGAIEAFPDTITSIVVALSGVERVTNPASASAGVEVETRDNFEARRSQSVSANAKNTDASVVGAVGDIPNVVDVWAKSNNSSTPTTFGATNYPVEPNSILVAVVGGVDYDIAWQMLTKAGNGCSFTGNTEVTVYDRENYPVDPPDYQVKFLRPNFVTISFRVQVNNIETVSYQDALALRTAIIEAQKSGTTRATIAQYIRAVQYASKITTAEVISIKVSKDAGATWEDAIQLGVDQFPVTTVNDVLVVS